MPSPHGSLRALLLSLACLAASAPASRADEFTDFRIPEHTWSSGTGGLWLSGANTNSNDLSQSRSGSIDGVLQVDVSRGHDADRRQTGWSVTSYLFDSARHERGSSLHVGTASDDWDTRAQFSAQRLSAGAWGRFYPGSSSFGLALSASLEGRWEQAWARQRDEATFVAAPGERGVTTYTSDRDDDRYALDADVAWGHGIVRDATPVEEARVVEAHLRETGVLAGPLSASAREKLAALYAVAPRISDVHDRPERYFWREIERVLVEDGAVGPEGVEAYDLVRAMERPRFHPTRLRGHFAAIVVGLRHRNQVSNRTYGYVYEDFQDGVLAFRMVDGGPSRDATSSDAVVAGVSAEWHRPAGERWQLDAAGSVTAPVRPGEKGLAANAALGASWHVADRWQVRASVQHLRDYVERASRDDSPPRDEWQFLSSAALDYYLEDHTMLTASVSDQQHQDRTSLSGATPLDTGFSGRLSFALGVTYRFLGRVSAPGLFGTMTPMRAVPAPGGGR